MTIHEIMKMIMWFIFCFLIGFVITTFLGTTISLIVDPIFVSILWYFLIYQ